MVGEPAKKRKREEKRKKKKKGKKKREMMDPEVSRRGGVTPMCFV